MRLLWSLATACFALSAASPLVAAAQAGSTPSTEPIPEGHAVKTGCHEPRGAIVIATNAEFTQANGVRRGSGTSADPYVIECWTVDSNSTHGIEFGATTAHFLLKDTYVASPHGVCLLLNGTANGIVERFGVGRESPYATASWPGIAPGRSQGSGS